MGLKGRLEDLPLLDMLQIIAFSRKSGYLRIAASQGRGAVMLKEGRVLFSYSWSTLGRLEELVRHPERITPELIREQIEASLRELGGLREGHFQFELADPNSDDFGGVKIQPFLLPQGLDAQELLLDLAVEIDNERREATSLLELAFQGDVPAEGAPGVDETEGDLVPPSLALSPSAAPAKPAEVPAPSQVPVEPRQTAATVAAPAAPTARRTVVLVDDEAPVREIVGEELESKGYRVFTASNPARGATLVREKSESGERVVVVVDLKMPTSSERSFYGGFELIRRVQRHDPETPVLLMVESITDKAKARARELGIRRLAYKPTLSKIDPDLYQKDLRQFASEIDEKLARLQEDGVAKSPTGNGRLSPEPAPGDSERMDFLAAMTRKLVEPGGSADVSRLVILVAARFLERGVLFVVKGDTARGLAGYGIAKTEKDCAEIAHGIAIDTNTEAIAETVRRCAAHRVREELGSLDDTLYAVIDRRKASEAVLIPLLYNRATLLLLYGDNGKSGRTIGDLSGLELFMAQAGMALENKLLQRKLSAVEPESAQSQGADVGV